MRLVSVRGGGIVEWEVRGTRYLAMAEERAGHRLEVRPRRGVVAELRLRTSGDKRS